MAFTSTINDSGKAIFAIGGGFKMSHGTYASSGGSTGGNIDTGIRECHILLLSPKDTSVESNAPVVNETYPTVGNAVTIVTDANEEGSWLAIGK